VVDNFECYHAVRPVSVFQMQFPITVDVTSFITDNYLFSVTQGCLS